MPLNSESFHNKLKVPVAGGLADSWRVIEAFGKFEIKMSSRLNKQLFGL